MRIMNRLPIDSAPSGQGEKRTFLTLNALRGVAALSVLAEHLRLWFSGVTLLGHASLAVDFFFMLSGFVVAHAYEQRLRERMTFQDFAKIRAIRLYPLLILATALGACFELVRSACLQQDSGLPNLLVLAVLGALSLAIPQGVGPSRQFFPLNWPAWSLFFEIAVNLIYALIVRVLSMRLLVAITLASAAALALVSLAYGRITIGRGYHFFIGGIPRVAFPFFAGLLLYRLYRAQKLPKIELHTLLVALMLFATFVAPPARGTWNAAFEVFCVMVVFPAVLIAGCQQEPPAWLAGAARVGGELSYPIYILHFPLLGLFTLGGHAAGLPQGYAATWYVLAGVIFVIALSYLILKVYDEPVRRTLSRRRRAAIAHPVSLK
jgi:peptidoglycan/LPS O-acetylase OafA/YrhL